MEVHIDAAGCSGHAVCEAILPDVFELRDDGVAYLRRTDFDESERPDLEEAVQSCPARALRLER